MKSRDLRHAFGTRYPKEDPGQRREIAEPMDHFDLSPVRRYALSDAERARAGVAKL